MTDPRKEFIAQLRRYQMGSISRRHFLGVTGLGTAMAVMAGAVPGLRPRPSFAGDIGDKVALTSWPNYHDQANLDKFKELTGAAVELTVFGSNEEMYAKLKAGGTGWDVFVPTNYTIANYVEADLIDPLDVSQISNYDLASYSDPRMTEPGTVNGKIYALHKDWGTTGFVQNTKSLPGKLGSWKEFWDTTKDKASGRVMVHDYQLTTIGNALKYFGYSFNSIDEKELADAEKLLLEVKPHLFGISSDYQPAMRNGDAWMSVAWTGDGKQLHKDIPEIDYILGKEGGEIWSDFYAVPKEAPNKKGAYALINFLLDPEVNTKELLFHGYPVADKRVIAKLPPEIANDPIMYPAAELLTPLEFGAGNVLTNPARAEIMARFKSA